MTQKKVNKFMDKCAKRSNGASETANKRDNPFQ